MSISPAKLRNLDHLVLPTANLVTARARLSGLGFTVAPVGVHPFGTENACIYFSGGTFIEPLAVADKERAALAIADGNEFVSRDRQFRARNGDEGLSALVFGTENADQDHDAFVRAGISAGARLDFSRPFVDTSGRADTASFRLAFSADAQAPDAFFFTCERVNAPKVDRSALQAHANGVSHIAAVAACGNEPTAFRDFFEKMTGGQGRSADDARIDFPLSNATISLINPAAFRQDFGVDAPQAVGFRLSAIIFAVNDRAATERLFKAGSVVYETRNNRLVVPTAKGQGAVFAFEEIR
ncbi:VOC family protein [Pseudaminobacter sp. NGMCC 1.201702]|uniref:VOC family protein n=1 Tax=Pseudaminobacter sp. NGMCC 1.201702 TaxID=3391825 RepID=UPI0039EEF4E3